MWKNGNFPSFSNISSDIARNLVKLSYLIFSKWIFECPPHFNLSTKFLCSHSNNFSYFVNPSTPFWSPCCHSKRTSFLLRSSNYAEWQFYDNFFPLKREKIPWFIISFLSLKKSKTKDSNQCWIPGNFLPTENKNWTAVASKWILPTLKTRSKKTICAGKKGGSREANKYFVFWDKIQL